MSTACENKALVRRFIDEVQNIAATDEFIGEDATDHTPPPGVPGTREGAKQLFGMIRDAFPDHDAAVVHMGAEGDLVATYKTFTGTHKGEFLGVPATDKTVTIRVMDFVRVQDGKITDHWNIVDVAGLLAQLGEPPT